VLLALGRLIDIKGFDDLLRALALLPATVGDRPWTVLIAGDGPLAEPLRNLAQKLGLAERLRWLGWQDPPDRCYAVADAFLCPSRREALGNVILEAWNYRLPVIATRTPGALELIEPEVSGLLCDIGDAAGLAARIRELLAAQAAHRNALGAAGHRYLASRCSRRAVVEAYLQLYAQLAAGGS
jgi:glycosyltransferase involved in cell wall biosynthesis